MKKFAKNMKRAFTITELVIVIAVIAILAAVLIPTFAGVISSAKESAAMQECRNALTVYTEQASEENKPTAGVVFVNNNYAFVNLSGNLHLLGELKDLININVDGTVTNNKEYDKLTINETKEGQAVSISITITDEKSVKHDPEVIDVKKAEDSAAGELLYIYSVEVNGTTYIGYFTLEQVTTGHPASYIVSENSTLYSRKCGYVGLIGVSPSMVVDVKTPVPAAG